MEESGEIKTLSANDLKKLIAGKEKKQTVFEFINYIVEQLNESNKVGNAAVYNDLLNLIKQFRKEKDLTFEQINYSFLKKLESYCYARGNKINSVSVRMRTLRAIYNKAIKEKVVEEKHYPFKDYKIENQKTKKRAIQKSDIEKIQNIDSLSNPKFYNTRNYFLLSFYLRGISFYDLAKLRLSNISDGRIMYIRSKTKSEFSIKITTSIQKILDIYIKGKKKSDYILPIIKRSDPVSERKDIRNALKNYNTQLKEIGKIIELEKPLTSYVARHSWASIALKIGIPIEVISEGLGHEDLKTTQIYLDGIDSETLDNANDLITG